MGAALHHLEARTGRHLPAGTRMKAGQSCCVAFSAEGVPLILRRTAEGFYLTADVILDEWADAFGVLPCEAGRVALGDASWPAAQARVAGRPVA